MGCGASSETVADRSNGKDTTRYTSSEIHRHKAYVRKNRWSQLHYSPLQMAAERRRTSLQSDTSAGTTSPSTTPTASHWAATTSPQLDGSDGDWITPPVSPALPATAPKSEHESVCGQQLCAAAGGASTACGPAPTMRGRSPSLGWSQRIHRDSLSAVSDKPVALQLPTKYRTKWLPVGDDNDQVPVPSVNVSSNFTAVVSPRANGMVTIALPPQSPSGTYSQQLAKRLLFPRVVPSPLPPDGIESITAPDSDDEDAHAAEDIAFPTTMPSIRSCDPTPQATSPRCILTNTAQTSSSIFSSGNIVSPQLRPIPPTDDDNSIGSEDQNTSLSFPEWAAISKDLSLDIMTMTQLPPPPPPPPPSHHTIAYTNIPHANGGAGEGLPGTVASPR